MKIRIFESEYADQLQEEVNAFMGSGIEVLDVQHSSLTFDRAKLAGHLIQTTTVIHHTIVVSYNDVNAKTSDPYDDDIIDDLKWSHPRSRK